MKGMWELLIVLLISWNQNANAQNEALESLGRSIMETLGRVFGPSSNNAEQLRMAEAYGKLQPRVPDDAPFPCSINNTRSRQRPVSVHSLRPGDIDIIGAIGDSQSTGQSALATTAFQMFTQSRGTSFSAGGQGTWRQYLTLPNILKGFNPKLIGYSDGESFLSSNKTGFNIAEAGTRSGDMVQMVDELIARLKNDSRVNIEKDWKLITIFIGALNFAGEMCYSEDSQDIVEDHRNDLTMTLRKMKKYLPRTIVNVIPSLHLRNIRTVTKSNMPPACNILLSLFVPCIFGLQFQKHQTEYDKIMTKWQEMQSKVVYQPDFDTDDFTVLVQPFTLGYNIPRTKDGLTDYSYLTPECLHVSQKTAAIGALSLWNNMMEPVEEKSAKFSHLYNFKCPSADQPFIFTRRNSIR